MLLWLFRGEWCCWRLWFVSIFPLTLYHKVELPPSCTCQKPYYMNSVRNPMLLKLGGTRYPTFSVQYQRGWLKPVSYWKHDEFLKILSLSCATWPWTEAQFYNKTGLHTGECPLKYNTKEYCIEWQTVRRQTGNEDRAVDVFMERVLCIFGYYVAEN